MRKKIEWEWEKLDDSTWRVKVIGGWLVLHVNQIIVTDAKKREIEQRESMVFISDRDHEWTVVAPRALDTQKQVKEANLNALSFDPKL
jgi:hypothetical protein